MEVVATCLSLECQQEFTSTSGGREQEGPARNLSVRCARKRPFPLYVYYGLDHLELVLLVTVMVSLDTAWLASFPRSSRCIAMWTTWESGSGAGPVRWPQQQLLKCTDCKGVQDMHGSGEGPGEPASVPHRRNPLSRFLSTYSGAWWGGRKQWQAMTRSRDMKHQAGRPGTTLGWKQEEAVGREERGGCMALGSRLDVSEC